MNYEIKVDDKVVEVGPNKKYSEWEDTFFKSVYFENQYSVNANSRINILMKMNKNFATNEGVTSYYGSSDYNGYLTVENEHMGLFTISSGVDSTNGTSVSQGQIPTIFYFLD
jgi:hypothetical protein